MTLFLKDPSWYLNSWSQSTPVNIYSNAVFLLLGVYYLYKKTYPLLGISLIGLFFGSTLFHFEPSRETLFVDRLTMVFVFANLYAIFKPDIPIAVYFGIGLVTILYWYKTEELIYFMLYQALGLVLFFIYYPASIIQRILFITLVFFIQVSQLIEGGRYHSLKHILLASILYFILY